MKFPINLFHRESGKMVFIPTETAYMVLANKDSYLDTPPAPKQELIVEPFKCPDCLKKDAQIEALKKQIAVQKIEIAKISAKKSLGRQTHKYTEDSYTPEQRKQKSEAAKVRFSKPKDNKDNKEDKQCL